MELDEPTTCLPDDRIGVGSKQHVIGTLLTHWGSSEKPHSQKHFVPVDKDHFVHPPPLEPRRVAEYRILRCLRERSLLVS